MKEQNEKQAIEEMAKDICCICHAHKNCVNATPCTMAYKEAEQLYTDNGFRKQSAGEWLYDLWDAAKKEYVAIPFIEGEHGLAYCSICNDPSLLDRCGDPVASDFCPSCGAKMKGGAE